MGGKAGRRLTKAMLESIKNRRSIRKFTDEPVSESDIHALLECAMFAPSALNERPWRFIVIDDRDTIRELSARHPRGIVLEHAPLCICVCGVDGPAKGYWPQDCSNATMNILTAAQELGLGACWMGVTPLEDRMAAVREVLGIPDDVMPFNLIAVGHPAQTVQQPDRWDGSLIHKNRW